MNKLLLIGLALLLLMPIGVFGAINDNLTTYWNFDISGQPLQDNRGWSNLQVGSGTGNITGRIGNGRDINTSQYLRTENETKVIAPNLAGYSAGTTRGYTQQVWVYYDSIGAGVQDPFGGTNATAGGTINSGYVRANNANTYYDVRRGAGGETTVANAHSSTTWYHYVLVYDAVTSYKSLYKNGVMISNVSVGAPGVGTTITNNSWIGYGSPSLTFDGRVDEIGIWNRTLSASEVSYLYNSGNGRSCSEINCTVSTPATTVTLNGYDFYTNATVSNFSALVSNNNQSLDYNNADGLVAWYLNDANNQTAPDNSGNGNTGTLNGYSFNNLQLYGSPQPYLNVSGKYGSAYTFNSANGNYLNNFPKEPTSTNSKLSNGYTLATWVNIENLPSITDTSEKYFFGIQNLSASFPYTYLLLRNQSGSTSLRFRLQTNGTNCDASISHIITSANTSEWIYMTGTYNSSSQRLNLFINGNYVTQSGQFSSDCTTLFSNVDNSVKQIWVGGNSGSTGKSNATVDEPRFWNRTLTNAEIIQEMNSAYPVNGNGLVASYSFESNFTNATGNYTYDTNNLVAGQINGSFRFDGISTYVNSSTNLVPTSNNNFTFSLWAKALTGNLYVGGFDNSSSSNSFMYFRISSTGSYLWSWRNSSSSTTQGTSNSLTNSYNSWVFLTAVYDGTNITTYQNGARTDSIAFPYTTLGGFTKMCIGALCRNAVANYFNGSIDDVRIYNTSLTADQINKLYLAGAYRIYNYSTTNGTINTGLGAGTYNVTVTSAQHWVETYVNQFINVTLNAMLQPYYLLNNIFYAKDFYTQTNLMNFSITDQFGNTTSTTTGVINASLYSPYNNFQRYNITYSSTQNGGYFNQSYLNLNTSSVTNTNMSQSVIGFTATQKVTGALITNANFTTNYTTNTTHYMTAQPFQVTTTAPLYINRTETYTPVALSSATYNFANLTNQNLSLVVRYALNGSTVPAYTVTISNSTYGYSETYYVTSQTTYVLNITSGVYYSIYVNSSDALSNTTTFYSTAGAYTLNITLVSTTQFNLYFFDEQTLLPVNNVNYTITGATYAYTGSTAIAGNNVNFTALSTDSYEIRYVDNNQTYNPRSYFVTIPLTSATQANLSLYMLKTTNATSFVLTVTDTYNQPIAGLTASLLRRYAIGGVTTYYVVEMMKPSVALQGATPFSGVANTVPYIFRVQDSAGNVLFQGAGTSSTNLETQYLLSTNVYIKVQTESSVLQGAQNFFGLSTTLTNTTTALQLSWSGSATTLTEICLQMYANTTTQITNSCSSNPSGIISYTYNPTVGTRYTGFVYARSSVDGKMYLIGNPFVDDRTPPSTSPGWGGLGVFLVIMILMLVGIGFADRPSVSIIIGGATIFAFFTINAFGQIIKLPGETSFILGSSALLLSFIIAYAMREEF